MNNFVCIHTAQNSLEANLLKSHLENEGILCIVNTQDASGTLPQLQFLEGGAKLFVHKDDVERSLETLRKNKK